jgi:hypothetical protein
MLSVFIDELGAGFYDYIVPASEVLLRLTTFTANDSIRQTTVSALPGLIKCFKQKNGVNQDLYNMARAYNTNIFAAMKEETETDCLISQVAAVREIILEMGPNFLAQQEVDEIGEMSLRIIDKSLKRIEELDDIKNEEVEDEDD